jgi:hypothetical protein
LALISPRFVEEKDYFSGAAKRIKERQKPHPVPSLGIIKHGGTRHVKVRERGGNQAKEPVRKP